MDSIEVLADLIVLGGVCAALLIAGVVAFAMVATLFGIYI